MRALRSGLALFALLVLASCDSAEPATIPILRIVGATIETAPRRVLTPRAQTVEVGRQETNCSGDDVDCLDSVIVNPTLGNGTRVVFDTDVRLDDATIPAGEDVFPRLSLAESLYFWPLNPGLGRSRALPARLVVPEGSRITVSWTTTEGETLTASADVLL